jgi:AcrR family transcriptional regulator
MDGLVRPRQSSAMMRLWASYGLRTENMSAATKPQGKDTVSPPDLIQLSSRDAQILTVSARIFARRGYRNTDVQEIADELGIGKATIYRAFGTKEELFFATVDYGMSSLNANMCAQKSKEVGEFSAETMERAIHTFLSFFDQNPDLIELLMQERSEFRERESNSFIRHWRANYPQWAENFRKRIEVGTIRNLPVEDLVEVLSGLVYGQIFINYFSKKRINLERMAKSISDIVCNGMFTESERKRRSRHKEEGES